MNDKMKSTAPTERQGQFLAYIFQPGVSPTRIPAAGLMLAIISRISGAEEPFWRRAKPVWRVTRAPQKWNGPAIDKVGFWAKVRVS